MIFASQNAFADDVIELFPMQRYDQKVTHWISPKQKGYDTPLISAKLQKERMKLFYKHYFGDASPWDSNFIKALLDHKADIIKTMSNLIQTYDNTGKSKDQINYGENFRPYSKEWIDNIAKNINLPQFDHLVYDDSHRAIAIQNLAARVLPTEDPAFYDHHLPGQGYPFDNLQMSALWAGEPVYILTQTKNLDWSYVLTPDNYMGWIKTNGIARVTPSFITSWRAVANKIPGGLLAITRVNTPIKSNEGRYLFSAYPGSVFPLLHPIGGNAFNVLVPVKNKYNEAVIQKVTIAKDDATPMPLSATPHHFGMLMEVLIGRPYGWGGFKFNNDCSAELKSLFTAFGIWLPRHSSTQLEEGKVIDVDHFAKKDPTKRLDYLRQNGHPFFTILYIGGHIILYVGNYPNVITHDTQSMVMTYQNLWGLTPIKADKRVVIGQSVLFPMLLSYPEDISLVSLAAKTYFKISYLDEAPSANLLRATPEMNVKLLMYSDAMLNGL